MSDVNFDIYHMAYAFIYAVLTDITAFKVKLRPALSLLQHNSTLISQRCKLVTNVWYVNYIFANCKGNMFCEFYIIQE